MIPGLGPGLGHDADVTRLGRRDHAFGQRLDVDIPLVGQPRLDHHLAAVAKGGGDDAVLDLDQRALGLQPRDHCRSRREPIEPEQVVGDKVVLRLADMRLAIEHVEHPGWLETGALADLEIVEVMARRDLHRAASELRIGMLVGDDRDQPPGDRQPHLLAEQCGVARVLGMHRDRHVGEHRLGPGGSDLDRARAVCQRIAQGPELARDFLGLDLEIADRGAQLGVPVDEPLVAIDAPALVQLDEGVEHGLRKALVHGEALVRPVAGRAEAAQLAGDLAPALRFPLPHLGHEFVAGEVGALLLLLGELALDHHLGGDPGMVGADHPQGVAALHPRAANEDVLQRDVERMADVQAARDVGRRHDDRIGLGRRARRAEAAAALPMAVPAGLDRAGFEGLGKFGHGALR